MSGEAETMITHWNFGKRRIKNVLSKATKRQLAISPAVSFCPAPDQVLDPCLTPRELARRWRCRPSTIRAMVRRGALQAMQLNGRVRITPEAIWAAETGPLAVRPIRRRGVRKIDPEIAELLK